MRKEKSEKRLNVDFENLKDNRDKRDFIKKSLLGIGVAGVAVGILATPLSKAVGNTALVSNLNVDLLDSQDSSYYRCSCSWACTTTCTGGCSASCSTGCTTNCTGCNGCNGCSSCSGCSGCTDACSGCGGCDGSCTGTCSGGCGGCDGTCTGGCDGSCVGSCFFP